MSKRHERLSHSRVLTTNEEKTFRESSVGKIRSGFSKSEMPAACTLRKKGGGGEEKGKGKKKQSYS